MCKENSCSLQNFAQPSTHIGPIIPARQNLIPDKKDRDLWWSFLSGRPESEWNLSKKAKQKVRMRSAGMRGWSDSQRASTPVQTSMNNDEGEVEEELRIDPAETLPSPKGTPVPLDYLEAISQPSSSGPTTSHPAPEEENFVPREPTTQFLKLIDEVHFIVAFLLRTTNSSLIALCLTSADVFYPLDKPLPQLVGLQYPPPYRLSCEMDLLSSFEG